MTDLAEVMVQHFEGCRLTAYKDTKGLWTIGWGHLLDQSIDWTGHTITQETADALLDQDMTEARELATRFPNYPSMNDVRQAVCISMCFQMGDKPLYWPHFMTELAMSDYKAAAAAGRDSDWWRTETRTRAEAEMSMLESGNWEIVS